ncbi:hybrid sensor histidine kinase/response regulator [candidate division KSB1 bacterium]|nr:hybrid sensor histidine kinase/response regulator [candidate division KSB1 bacterium]
MQINKSLGQINIPHTIDWTKSLDELVRQLRIMPSEVILISQDILTEAQETHLCNLSYSVPDAVWIVMLDDPDSWIVPKKCPIIFQDFLLKPSDLNQILPFRITQALQRARLNNIHMRHIIGFKLMIEKFLYPICICDNHFQPLYKNNCWESTVNEKETSFWSQINTDPIKLTLPSTIMINDKNNLPMKMNLIMSQIEWEGETAYCMLLSPYMDTLSDQSLKTSFYSNVKSHLIQPAEQLMDLLKDRNLNKIEYQKATEKAHTITSQLYTKISAITEISQIENGSFSLKKEKFDLLPVFNNAIQKYTDQTNNSKITLQVLLPDSINPLLGDKDRIKSIIEHLLDNAFKYTKQGNVDISVLAGKDHVACSVLDTGVGLKPEKLKTIFDPLESLNDGQQVLNMGLPLVKVIIKAHGGKIWMESEPGQGCRLTFTLPYYNKKSVLESELLQAQRKNQSTNNVFTLFTLQLSFFDDEELNIKITHLLKSTFKEVGFFLRDESSKYYLICQSYITIPMLRQFKKSLKQVLLENAQYDLLDFNFKLLEYPADAKNVETMIDQIDEDLKNEIRLNHQCEILIVDDEEAIIDTLNRMLRQTGYRHIHTASNGLQALNRIEKHIPDLIILDMRMPEMSGYELLGRLKENPKYRFIPVAIMSGYPLKNDLLERAECTPDIVTLNKPIPKDEFLHKVYYLL